MALPPPPKRNADARDGGDAVAAARSRARQRLLGAVVLLAAGLITFALVFETKPRPVALDVPIEMPRRDAAAPPVLGAPRAAVPATMPVPRDEPVTESRADQGRDLPATPAAASAPMRAAASAPVPRAVASAPAPRPAGDAARAQALLEGAASAPAAGRFVVQVGAFADPDAAREARQKVEKIGLKTYTQVAETAAGSRIRVRVGPFASRDDAERALGRAKAAGLDGVVLTL